MINWLFRLFQTIRLPNTNAQYSVHVAWSVECINLRNTSNKTSVHIIRIRPNCMLGHMNKNKSGSIIERCNLSMNIQIYASCDHFYWKSKRTYPVTISDEHLWWWPESWTWVDDRLQGSTAQKPRWCMLRFWTSSNLTLDFEIIILKACQEKKHTMWYLVQHLQSFYPTPLSATYLRKHCFASKLHHKNFGRISF